MDNDETSFQVGQCIAKVVSHLPPLELFHANDATEGLQLLENVKPDIIVLDSEFSEESELFAESLASNHPPILLQTEGPSKKNILGALQVTPVPRCDSLEGLHQVLTLAASLAGKNNGSRPDSVH